MNIGKIIYEKVKDKGISVTELSIQLGCSRANVYKIFGKNAVSTDLLYKLSIVLETDFFKYYSNSLANNENCFSITPDEQRSLLQ